MECHINKVLLNEISTGKSPAIFQSLGFIKN